MVDRPEWDLRLGYLIHDVSRLRRMMFDRALGPARNNKVAVVGACIHFAQRRTSPNPTCQ